jgi:AcrR family transcriptional regulator
MARRLRTVPSETKGAASDGALDTRTMLLRTALRLFEQRGLAAVTLAEIAAAAGVSRQAIYLHFGNRAGLLTAIARYLDSTSSLVREMMATVREHHTKAGLGKFIRLAFQHAAVIFPFARAIEAAAASGDADARSAWEDRVNAVLRTYRLMIDGLAESRQLSKCWTREEATDWLYSRIHIDVWNQLVVDRKWPPKRLLERATESLWRDLLDDVHAPKA